MRADDLLLSLPEQVAERIPQAGEGKQDALPLRDLCQCCVYSRFSQIRGWHVSGTPCCLRRAGHAQRMAAPDEGCIRPELYN